MDFEKLAKLVDTGIVIDAEGANIHDVRATNDPRNDKSWRNFTPEGYSDEEELAAAISNFFRTDRVTDKEIYTD